MACGVSFQIRVDLLASRQPVRVHPDPLPNSSQQKLSRTANSRTPDSKILRRIPNGALLLQPLPPAIHPLRPSCRSSTHHRQPLIRQMRIPQRPASPRGHRAPSMPNPDPAHTRKCQHIAIERHRGLNRGERQHRRTSSAFISSSPLPCARIPATAASLHPHRHPLLTRVG